MQNNVIIECMERDVTWDNLVVQPCPFRDSLFKRALEAFDERPVNIFQIGAIETFEDKFRMGSGWSDLWFGSYVKKFGGNYYVADINIDHIANSLFLANAIGYQCNARVGDGLVSMQKPLPVTETSKWCDLYYLDGADISQSSDAHQQTLQQFKVVEKIANSRLKHTIGAVSVLVDDVPTKALDLIKYLDENGISYEKLPQFGSGMIYKRWESK